MFFSFKSRGACEQSERSSQVYFEKQHDVKRQHLLVYMHGLRPKAWKNDVEELLLFLFVFFSFSAFSGSADSSISFSLRL